MTKTVTQVSKKIEGSEKCFQSFNRSKKHFSSNVNGFVFYMMVHISENKNANL